MLNRRHIGLCKECGLEGEYPVGVFACQACISELQADCLDDWSECDCRSAKRIRELVLL